MALLPIDSVIYAQKIIIEDNTKLRMKIEKLKNKSSMDKLMLIKENDQLKLFLSDKIIKYNKLHDEIKNILNIQKPLLYNNEEIKKFI